MAELTFTRATRPDLPAIVAIYNEAVPSRTITADLAPVTVAESVPWFEAHSDKRPLFIIKQDERLLGWLSLSDFYGRIAYQATVEISIYLDAAAKGHGVGSKSVAFAHAWAKENGLETILAYIFSGNTPSLHLFEKFGYEQYANLPRVANMETSYQDLIILGKKIQTND